MPVSYKVAGYLSKNRRLVGPLSSVPHLLERFGVSPGVVLAAAGLSINALDDPRVTVPFESLGLLFEAAVENTGCASFGLEVGRQLQTRGLGLVGELMRNAPTIGDAFNDFETDQHRKAQGGVAYMFRSEQCAYLGYAMYRSHVRGYPFICDLVAMGGVNVLRELAGTGHKHCIEVLFSRAEPEDLTPYHSSFGVPLRFNAEQTALLVPRALLEQPVAGADATLRKVLETRAAAAWHAARLDVVTRLRCVLRVALIGGRFEEDEIARQIGMSRRTLHRRLAVYGLRFRDVLEQTRCAFAEQLLAHTRLSIGEVATIVGYADPSVLTRGFLRWTGSPPSKWRLIRRRSSGFG